MSVIQAVGKLRQETHESKVNLDYKTKERPDWATLKKKIKRSCHWKQATVRSSKQNSVKEVIIQMNIFSLLQAFGHFCELMHNLGVGGCQRHLRQREIKS